MFTGIKEVEIQKAVKDLLSKNLVLGAKETINELKRKGYLIVSYSSSPIWIMSELKKQFGFSDVC